MGMGGGYMQEQVTTTQVSFLDSISKILFLFLRSLFLTNWLEQLLEKEAIASIGYFYFSLICTNKRFF